ncbi:hypothetical protein ZIOFF_018523 [Zingiber officinale]|uniref:Uncharacterized protein n=1 Tax=Zingiber officinale TaxID=94328 RepID=A0A8J5HKX3_ZINOF|nr:hypothetical protein ZIOFF_018520 [Zingiber officinale]KAG6521406.1 hypothetical protein ZIOFF_018523 [Zingiber officinale]
MMLWDWFLSDQQPSCEMEKKMVLPEVAFISLLRSSRPPLPPNSLLCRVSIGPTDKWRDGD